MALDVAAHSCANCGHRVGHVNEPGYWYCARNVAYCNLVFAFPMNHKGSCSAEKLIHWIPRPPTLLDRIGIFFEHLFW